MSSNEVGIRHENSWVWRGQKLVRKLNQKSTCKRLWPFLRKKNLKKNFLTSKHAHWQSLDILLRSYTNGETCTPENLLSLGNKSENLWHLSHDSFTLPEPQVSSESYSLDVSLLASTAKETGVSSLSPNPRLAL